METVEEEEEHKKVWKIKEWEDGEGGGRKG